MTHDIVLLHGMWCTAANWSTVRGLLERAGFDCHAPTLPGHELGVEHPECGTLSLLDYGRYLDDWIARLGLSGPPILVGHSMGGLLAQMLSTKVKPAALVLLTPASPAGINPVRFDNAVAFWRTLATPAFWRKSHKPSPVRAAISITNGLPADRQAEIYATLVPESGRALFEIALWWLDGRRASTVDSAAIKCPVYVVSAGRDHLTPPAVVRRVAGLYPQASLRHYPEFSHWVLDGDGANAVVDEIVSWLRAVSRNSTAKIRDSGA